MLKLLALKCVLRINSFLHEIAEGIAHQTFQYSGRDDFYRLCFGIRYIVTVVVLKAAGSSLAVTQLVTSEL